MWKVFFKDVNFFEGIKCVFRLINKVLVGFEIFFFVMVMYEFIKFNIKKYLGCYKFYKGVIIFNEENVLYYMDDYS